jgi:hypothetical protein
MTMVQMYTGALMNLELACISKRQKLQMRWQTKLLLAVLFSQMTANLFAPVLAENIQPPSKKQQQLRIK